jgi:hypothetical protein
VLISILGKKAFQLAGEIADGALSWVCPVLSLNKNNNMLHLLSRFALVAQEVAINNILRLKGKGLKATREANKSLPTKCPDETSSRLEYIDAFSN